MGTITFNDPEAGIERTGNIEATGFVGEQQYHAVESDGVDWIIPIGWPNNQLPICRESDPDGYFEIYDQIKGQ